MARVSEVYAVKLPVNGSGQEVTVLKLPHVQAHLAGADWTFSGHGYKNTSADVGVGGRESENIRFWNTEKLEQGA